MLLANWPSWDAGSDETLLQAQLVEIFLAYPPSVTASVTSPLTGMQRDATYAKRRPTTPQIVAALELAAAKLHEHNARMRTKRIAASDPPRDGRPSLEELQAKFPWLNLSRDRQTRPAAAAGRGDAFTPLGELMRQAGVTQEQLDDAEKASKR